MADLSPTTGEEYYSGPWEMILKLCKTLNVGEGKLADINQAMVNDYQEMIDREIDDTIGQYYYTPLRSHRQYIIASDETKTIFPGGLRSLALYWVAGTLLLSEFQGIDPNITEQVTNFISESKQKLFDIIRFSRRIPGQRTKSNLKTMPPSMQPGVNPEANF